MHTMTNRYPGDCTRCGHRVAAGQGLATKGHDKRWSVAHADDAGCQHAAAAAPSGPATKSATVDLPDVAEGRYAVVDPVDGLLKFYRVDRPQEGRWAGWTFIRVLAGPDSWPIKAIDTKRAILERIAEDPRGALLRYGREIEVCGACGTRLTDELSRKSGIGPVCARNRGIDRHSLTDEPELDWDSMIAQAEADAEAQAAWDGLDPQQPLAAV